jgi:glycosyltransferase involved in cell wall biosynthesis
MKILVVTPFPILPLTHGGRVRTYGMATALANAGATVDLLCPWQPGLPPRSFSCDGITCHPHFFVANILPRLFSERLMSPLVALSWQPFFFGPRRRLDHLARCDIAQFHFCAHPAWMERLRVRTRVVYVAHNVEADYLRARSRDSILDGIGLRCLAALEQRAVHAADLVVSCARADAERMAELYGPGPEYAVIPQGFDVALQRFDRVELRARTRASLGIMPEDLAILFVGGPAEHNRDAVRFLEYEVMPNLKRRACLLIAGQCGDPRSNGSQTVRRLGYVQDLRPLFSAADVAVNPVRYGAGSSVKVTEYLAVGLPVVTTPAGIRGHEDPRSRLRVAELNEFAAVLDSLETGVAGGIKPTVASWNTLGLQLYDAYTRLLRASPGWTVLA